MKFTENKKEAIRACILEKITQQTPALAKSVADTFQINPSTVYAYLNELTASHVIRKMKRGQYELIHSVYQFELQRSNGDLDDDTYAYEICLRQYVSSFPENIRNIWSYAFSEMINNVMDHSAAEHVQIRIVQDELATEVMIQDDGVGIFEKIREYFHLPSLKEAICELFKGKLTTDAVNHSGEGIFFSSRLMDDFYIVSDGKLFTNNRYDDSRICSLTEHVQKGTRVVMKLSNCSRKTAKSVFDEYSDDDGGFTKTTIPLKHIFDASPVSRSQAKRVCNRLDRFQEIQVDFEDIEWIGQGFAHQMFVVFANQHPGLSLIPVHMNKDVEKMVCHVKQQSESGGGSVGNTSNPHLC